MKMAPQDFVDHYNYMVQGSEKQNPETLVELKYLISDMMMDNCGEVVNFDFINEMGQIKLIPDLKIVE